MLAHSCNVKGYPGMHSESALTSFHYSDTGFANYCESTPETITVDKPEMTLGFSTNERAHLACELKEYPGMSIVSVRRS